VLGEIVTDLVEGEGQRGSVAVAGEDDPDDNERGPALGAIVDRC
jgi:hypothetical protein